MAGRASDPRRSGKGRAGPLGEVVLETDSKGSMEAPRVRQKEMEGVSGAAFKNT